MSCQRSNTPLGRGRRILSRTNASLSSSQPGSVMTCNNSEESVMNHPRPNLERFVDGAEDSNERTEIFPNNNPTEASLDPDYDPETAELARLRCSSVQTEVITARSRRNGQHSASYPGLAFGSSVFGSNTMMKLRIISNELHNIMNVYLKRAEGEMVALNNRINVLGDDLGKSEEGIKVANKSLEEARLEVNVNDNLEEDEDTPTRQEAGRVALLDDQLSQARLRAEETDRDYKDKAKEVYFQDPGGWLLKERPQFFNAVGCDET